MKYSSNPETACQQYDTATHLDDVEQHYELVRQARLRRASLLIAFYVAIAALLILALNN